MVRAKVHLVLPSSTTQWTKRSSQEEEEEKRKVTNLGFTLTFPVSVLLHIP